MSNRSRQEKKSKTGNTPRVAVRGHDEAVAITQNVVKPAHTKQQRKEIQKAIEAGIAQYKREFKAKQRDYNKQGRKAIASLNQTQSDTADVDSIEAPSKKHLLPWILLGLSWLGFAVYILAY